MSTTSPVDTALYYLVKIIKTDVLVCSLEKFSLTIFYNVRCRLLVSTFYVRMTISGVDMGQVNMIIFNF